MGHGYQTQVLRQNIFPVIRNFIDPATHCGGNDNGKTQLSIQETSERIGQEKEKRGKKGNASWKTRLLKLMKIKKSRPL